jgi:MFS family permease
MRVLREFLRWRAKEKGEVFDSYFLPWLGVATVAGLVIAIIYALSFGWNNKMLAVLATELLVAGAAFLAGALPGFLFGLPKTTIPKKGEAATPIEANTNLEQISDWLTKILVGVGLVELTSIATQGAHLVSFLAPPLGEGASGSVVALSLLVFFIVIGFLVTFIAARLYLGVEMSEADKRMRSIVGAVRALVEHAAAVNDHDSGAHKLSKEHAGRLESLEMALPAAVTGKTHAPGPPLSTEDNALEAEAESLKKAKEFLAEL